MSTNKQRIYHSFLIYIYTDDSPCVPVSGLGPDSAESSLFEIGRHIPVGSNPIATINYVSTTTHSVMGAKQFRASRQRAILKLRYLYRTVDNTCVFTTILASNSDPLRRDGNREYFSG